MAEYIDEPMTTPYYEVFHSFACSLVSMAGSPKPQESLTDAAPDFVPVPEDANNADN